MPESVVIFAALDSVGSIVVLNEQPTTIVLPAPSTAAAFLARATPVILPDNAIGSVVIPDQNPGIVILENDEPEPPEPPQPIILDGPSTIVLDQRDRFVILTTDAPGMPGPPGAPGESATFTRIAEIPLSGHRVVKAVAGGKVNYASTDQLSDATLVEGITTGAASADADVEVQASGEMVESSWNWTLGAIYCGVGGQLTQTPPTSLWVRQVATAVDANRIVIELQPPILTA